MQNHCSLRDRTGMKTAAVHCISAEALEKDQVKSHIQNRGNDQKAKRGVSLPMRYKHHSVRYRQKAVHARRRNVSNGSRRQKKRLGGKPVTGTAATEKWQMWPCIARSHLSCRLDEYFCDTSCTCVPVKASVPNSLPASNCRTAETDRTGSRVSQTSGSLSTDRPLSCFVFWIWTCSPSLK